MRPPPPRCWPRACACSQTGVGLSARWPSWRCRRAAIHSSSTRWRGGLAAAGRLTYLGSLEYAAPPQGGPGGNSAFRLAQVFDAFAVPFALDGGAILLVDDLADSRWTLTVASRLLLRAGAGSVLPFTLALR